MKNVRFMFLGFMVLTAGCIELDQTLTIKKNGSGRFELTYSMSEQSIAQMKAMFKLKKELAMASDENDVEARRDDYGYLFLDPNEDQIRKDLRKYEKYGMILDRLKVEARYGSRHVHLKVLFNNLADLAKADFFPEPRFSLSRDSDGNYVLYRPPENPDYKTAMNARDPEAEKLVRPILSGFKVALKINTPGKILKTNASMKSLYTAVWRYDFDEDPNAFSELQNRPMEIVFDGKGLNLPEI